MENKYRWEQPLSEKHEYDVDVVVESSLAMAQATLQKAMRERGLRNADLAKLLNRPRPFISRIMSGSHNLTVKTLARVLAVCGYELNWEYRPVRWGWVKEPITIDIQDRNAVAASAAAATSAALGYQLAA